MSIIRSFAAVTALIGSVVLLAATPVGAQTGTQSGTDAEKGGREGEAGIGVAAGLISVFYAPAKVLYAAGGGLVSGLAYVVSAGDRKVVDPILTPALRGDYLVTPAHLRGERQLEFVGRQPEDSALRDAAKQPASNKSADGLDGAPPVSSDATEATEPASEPQ